MTISLTRVEPEFGNEVVARIATEGLHAQVRRAHMIASTQAGSHPDLSGAQAQPGTNDSLKLVLRSTWGATHTPPNPRNRLSEMA